MEILDINEFRFDSGVIFNDKDPRFETVLENHINKTQERLFKRTKDSPYFLMFDGIVSCLANCCFFVQIKEKMYGLGIENCWIKVFENDGEYIHCGLLASFHLYSTACGFYRVTNITIAEKTFMKCELEKERLFHIRTYSRNSCPFRAIFIEKEGDYERIKWKKVYKQQELKSIILKNYYLKTINPRLYLLEVAKNNKVFFSLESEKVYLLSSSFSFLAYAKVLEGIKKIIFTNYYKNEVLLIVPFKGLYKELQLIDWKLDDWFIENKLKTLFKNPLMLYTLDEIDKLYDLLLEKAQKNDMYFLEKPLNPKRELFEFTFKNAFDFRSDIALSIAMQSSFFKIISIEEYYTAFYNEDIENIELLFFTLKDDSNDKVICYLNKVSLLKKINDYIEIWKDFLSNCIGNNSYDLKNCHLLEKEYNRIFKGEIKNKGEQIYRKAISKGVYFGKWKSEQKMYYLITRYYPDAIYQFYSEWLGLQSLDVYIPSLKIAFEYQGVQHYKPTDFFGGEEGLKNNQERDMRKKDLCRKNNIILIEWKYDEEITKENLEKKLVPYIGTMPLEHNNIDNSQSNVLFSNRKKEKSLKPVVPKKVIVQYDTDGNYINHFSSQGEASEKTGASEGTISFVINGRQKTSGGFVWRYFYENEIPTKIEKTEIFSHKPKKVLQMDLNENIIKTFDSITVASKTCGVDRKGLKNVLNGKQKTAGGYKWKFME